ncbi:tape measure protein [Acinetobacter rudis]|uniref:tape measure protein n=1 Tax=Acinetobacter rudis TaxID=632955 RepID=UPI00281063B0|nr:tape measure protein [Acinetobacter rudis]MDQ8951938.1 tape measure protein [Acinetobacter rudis]
MANLGTLTLDLVAKIGQYVEPLNAAERKTKDASSSMVKQVDSVTEAMKKQQTEAEKTAKVIGFFASSAKALLGGITISTMVNMADGYGQMAAQIEIATKVTDDAAKSAEKYNYVQERLLKTANTTYRPLKEAQQVWLDVGGALEKVGYTTEQTLNITDSMSFAFTANATAADKATSATNAVTNSIIKNKVEADSWSSIMAAIPTITADLAKQTGKTEQEILKLGATGKLSAKDLAAAFEVSREKNEELANSMRNSVQDGFTRLVNEATVYIGKLNETTGATNSFAAMLSTLGENIDIVANASAIAGAVIMGRMVGSLYTSTAATIADSIAKQKKIMTDYEVAKAELAAAAAMAKATGAANAETVAMVASARATYQKAAAAKEASIAGMTLSKAGSGLLGVLGGPAGLIFTLATVAGGYYMMKGNTDKATESLDEHGKTTDELIQKYNELSESQRRAFKYTETKELKELTNEYEAAEQKISLYAGAIAKYAAKDEETRDLIEGWIEAFNKQQITSEELANKINSLTTVSDDYKNVLDTHIGTSNKAKEAMSKQQKVVETLTDKEAKIKKAHESTTAAVKSQADAYRDLSESQQKVIDKINQDAWRTAYIKEKVAAGWSAERAAYYADTGITGGYYDPNPKEGLSQKDATALQSALVITNSLVSTITGKPSLAGYQVASSGSSKPSDQLKLDDFSKKKLEEDFNSKYHQIDKNELKAFIKVRENAIKYNFADIEKLNGLPSGLLSAIHMNESRGNAKIVGPMNPGLGTAKGGFQLLDGTAKRFGLQGDDVFDLSKSANAAGKYLKYLYGMFGDWEKAVSAYHAGEGNVKAGTKIGPVNRKYVADAKRFTAAANNSTQIDSTFSAPTTEDILKLQNDAVVAKQSSDEAKRAMMIQLAPSPLKQMEMENEDYIKQIYKTFADQPEKLKEMLDRNNIIYQENRQKLILDTQAEYDQYFEFEKDRITQITNSYDTQKSLLGTNSKLGVKERADAVEALERQKQAEIEAVKLEERQQILQAQELYMTETEIVMKRYQLERDEIAKNTQLTKETREALLKTYDLSLGSQMDRNDQKIDDIHYESLNYLFLKKQPDRAAWSDLQNQYDGESGGLDKAYSEQRAGIFLGIEDEEERNAKLLAAHEEYLQAKQALNDKYDEEEKDLKKAQLDSQLASAEAGFGSMTEMLRKSGDERSGIYRTMLVMEKSAAIARSIMAIQTGIAEASANPFPYNIAAMASVAAATANIVSSIQSVSAGFYDGGYTGDGGKYVAAGIVHKGEVVWSQDDIARWGGVANVEAMRLGRSLGGYSDGGIVGSSSTRSFPNIDFSSSQSAPTVNIHTLPGQTADVEWNDGVLEVRMRKIAEDVNKQSWRNLGRPSSDESKAIRQHTTAGPRR